MTKKLWYTQSVPATIGTCVVWFAKNGGLTSDLRSAKTYTDREASDLVALSCGTALPWAVELIDELAESHVQAKKIFDSISDGSPTK